MGADGSRLRLFLRRRSSLALGFATVGNKWAAMAAGKGCGMNGAREVSIVSPQKRMASHRVNGVFSRCPADLSSFYRPGRR
jgi:hypothetical protein